MSNNTISVCFGHYTTETIYELRDTVLSELEYTWGNAVGFLENDDLNFSSNGVCNNDGSELRIIWNWDWTCEVGGTDPWGKMIPSTGTISNEQWSYALLYLNRDCQVRERFDWTPYNGITTGDQSTLRIIAHEFGHALGIDHASSNATLMWGNTATSACGNLGVHERITWDEVDAVWQAYSAETYWFGGPPASGSCLP